MHSSANLLACTPMAASASLIISSSSGSCTTINPNPNKTSTSFYNTTTSTIPLTRGRKHSQNSITCKAKASSSDDSVLMEDLDLYELLGVDSSCDLSQIKLAYRALQKRCHPDIAGPAGHDMAIILNQIYSLLSDPNSRSAYDKEQAKIAELRGYTGKPIYSVWFGAESEERAVFVDEVNCVGCLKCALLAEKTFAVESVYGRARVVAQWADPENKIEEAIEACPVDCISIVERSNLGALEYLMSKQPRGSVRIGAGNAVGTRVSNIFVDVDKFQARFQEAMNKASAQQSKVPNSQREATCSAVQAIRAISNWLYWQTPSAGSSSENLTRPGSSKRGCNKLPDISKLQEAAATRKHARENGKPTLRIPSNYKHNEEYWIPSTLVLPHPTTKDISAGSEPALKSAAATATAEDYLSERNNKEFTIDKGKKRDPFIIMGVPMAAAIVAAAVVGLQVGEGVSSSSGRLEEHIGGSLALGIINSSQLQVILAGITWYLIAAYVVELIEGLRNKMYKK